MAMMTIPLGYMVPQGYYEPSRLPCYCKEPCNSCGEPREGDMKIFANHYLHVNDVTDYVATHFLGRGVFGQVVQAVRVQTGKTVAIKVLKNTPSYYEQGKTELNVLLRLLKNGAERQPVTHLVEAFELTGHLCLVFELYRENVYEYLKKNRFTPFSVTNIRYIGLQLLQALDFLLVCNVIHTDIKPENIMFVNGAREFEIKLIDFGSAVVTDRPALECCYLQSRYYRSPEVLVRSEITAASDMFSVGCVLAELYIGYPLMAGNNEYEQLRLIMEMVGPLPNNLIASGKSGTRFFNFYVGPDNNVMAVLKSEEQIDRVSMFKERRKQCHNIRNLNELQYYKRPSHYDENSRIAISPEVERYQFADLLSRMLSTDPKRRANPATAKFHTFFSGIEPHFAMASPMSATPSPQALQMAVAQQQQQCQTAALNQYLSPAYTAAICQQLSYAPAVYVQNMPHVQNNSAAQLASTMAALVPQAAAIAASQNLNAAVATAASNAAPMQAQYVPAAMFTNPAVLHQSFNNVVQQLTTHPQYAQQFQLVAAAPAHNGHHQVVLGNANGVNVMPQQQAIVLNPNTFCYQLVTRPASRSRSPL
uniref:Protein kinase domain-containing protein n=1 Tax=Panagrellus redivivus TaxID=6233 RepID=A0A7E4V1E4_PANRE